RPGRHPGHRADSPPSDRPLVGGPRYVGGRRPDRAGGRRRGVDVPRPAGHNGDAGGGLPPGGQGGGRRSGGRGHGPAGSRRERQAGRADTGTGTGTGTGTDRDTDVSTGADTGTGTNRTE